MYDYLKEPEKFGHVTIRKDLIKYSFVVVFVSINNNFIIKSINGSIDQTIVSKTELNLCLKEVEEVEKVFSKIFKNYKISKNTQDHPIDPSGKSKVHYTKYLFGSGDSAQLQCFDFEEKLRNNNNWSDGLSVVVRKKEISQWLVDRK